MNYPLLNVIWSMTVFFCWILWIWLLIVVYTDVFRRQDIGGWAKTGWVVFTLFLPFLGVFTYLVTQGRGMGERSAERARTQQAAMDEYVRSVAATSGGTGGVDQLAKAKSLLDSGALTEDEYAKVKSKVLA